MSTTDRDPEFEALIAPLAIAEEKGRPRFILEEALLQYYWKGRASIPPERRAEAERLAKQFVTDGEELLHRDDRQSVSRFVGEFARAMQIVSRPIPQPTVEDVIEGASKTLVYRGWCGLEIDFLRAWLKPGERLIRFDAWSAETDTGRKTTREELREKNRPLTWTRLDTWADQFPPIPER